MEEKEKKNEKAEVDVKTKRKKAKIAVISLCTIVVLFIGLQVYASTNGYGNVFFMIRDLVTGKSASGEDQIFSDKDITLSYKSIELAEGLKIQANRLEVRDGKTNLYLTVKSQNGELLPLKYSVVTKNIEGTETTTTTNITGTKPESADNYSYEDVLKLDYEVNENKIIVLKVCDSSDKTLRTLEINLQTREITVTGESELKKISKIELREYLDIFSDLNNGAGKSDTLVYIAQKIESKHEELIDDNDYKEAKQAYTDRAFKNAIIKEVYGDKADFEYQKQADTTKPDVEVLKGMQAWEFDKQSDSYKALTAGEDYRNGHCLKIEDISFEGGVYTVKYIYILATGYEEDGDKLEDLPQYEATIKLKRDENNLYSKYQVISITDGVSVKEKVSTKVDENTDNDIILSDIKQTLKSAWYTVDLYENNEIRITFASEDFDKMYGNLGVEKEKSYPITGISGKVSKMYQANNGGGVDPMTFFVLEDGTVEYILPFEQINEKIPDTFIIDGKSDKVQNVVDLKTSDSDVVIAVLKNGEEVKIWNEWREFDQENESNSNTTEDSKLENEGDIGRAEQQLNNESVHDRAIRLERERKKYLEDIEDKGSYVYYRVVNLITEGNNSGKIYDVSMVHNKKGEDVGKAYNINLSFFIGKVIAQKIVDADLSTTYVEFCDENGKKNYNPPEEEYVLMFMCNEHQAHVYADTNNRKQLIISWYEEKEKDEIIAKCQLNSDAVELMGELFNMYKNQ